MKDSGSYNKGYLSGYKDYLNEIQDQMNPIESNDYFCSNCASMQIYDAQCPTCGLKGPKE